MITNTKQKRTKNMFAKIQITMKQNKKYINLN